MWEEAINVFMQRALAKQAWGDKPPRDVTIKQFKNKLNAVRSGYKTKRQRTVATGNRPVRDGDDSDNEERKYPEMPTDFLLDGGDEHSHGSSAEGGVPPRNLAYDPMNVNPNYRKELGAELAALWPLLCKVFSNRTGCTGEAITETGIGRLNDEMNDGHSDSSESPGEAHKARERAKSAAKAKRQRGAQVEQLAKKRPADAVSEALKSGFEAIERVFSNRHNSARPNGELTQMFGKLTLQLRYLMHNIKLQVKRCYKISQAYINLLLVSSER
ncbi:unnamed protein product [Phytophthora fragariaefolia]|uniref:Unnamed protein product n=1 Tax=Phytophthora fragariaefolia TaxID=1490495 RepID=A0A9W7D2I1_9STRA|nr:unnamed protein product [Phytophthora fragariaefolia]